jgi:hypothetical protein
MIPKIGTRPSGAGTALYEAFMRKSPGPEALEAFRPQTRLQAGCTDIRDNHVGNLRPVALGLGE